jgi:adenylate kinase
MIIVMLGPPGAGKGTQTSLLAERLGVLHVSTGDLLREAIAAQTPLGALAKGYIERGELVPDETMTSIVRERLKQPDAQRGAILDGFPRTVDQARALNRMLAELGRKVDAVVSLRVPTDEVLERIAGRYVCPNCGASYHLQTSPPRVAGQCDQCGSGLVQRPDDRREVAARRLEVYATQTAPVVDFYLAQGILHDVDGNQSINCVLESILKAIAPALRNNVQPASASAERSE